MFSITHFQKKNKEKTIIIKNVLKKTQRKRRVKKRICFDQSKHSATKKQVENKRQELEVKEMVMN